MKVFFGWSGERSKALAFALHGWVPLILQYVKPWISEKDITAGARWGMDIAAELQDSNFGIVCVTRENFDSPWIIFEAGSLAKSMSDGRVIPLLLDLDVKDVTGPLAQFQAKKADQGGIREVIRSVNASASQSIEESRASRLFHAMWPELERAIQTIPASEDVTEPGRSVEQILEELVIRIRALEAAVRTGDRPSGVQRMREPYFLRSRRLEHVTEEERGIARAVDVLRMLYATTDREKPIDEWALTTLVRGAEHCEASMAAECSEESEERSCDKE